MKLKCVFKVWFFIITLFFLVLGFEQLNITNLVHGDSTSFGKVKKFDHYKGHQVYKYTAQRKNGLKVSVLSQGSTLKGIYVPSKKNKYKNILLSFDHTKQYYSKKNKSFYVGQLIGPVGNRINKGQFMLDNKKYQLPVNENGNTLHSGPHAFNSVNWNGKVGTYKGDPAIIMNHHFKSSYTGFPGNIKATTRYVITKKNRLKVLMSAKSDRDTIFDPTIHAYFHLNNNKNVNKQKLNLNSSQRLALNKEKIPTGKLLNNAKTAYDFKNNTNLGKHLAQLKNTKEDGYDTMFKVSPEQNDQIAKLSDPQTKRSVTFSSNRNGLVVYSANTFNNKLNFASGKGSKHMALALEPQTLPDAVNHPSFGNINLKAGKTKTDKFTYSFNY